MGNAFHAKVPRIVCQMVSVRMFRSFQNNQAIKAPPTKVSGTRTGFGQWSKAKNKPEMREARSGLSIAARSRLVTREFRATCGNKQKDISPKKRSGLRS